MKYIVLILLLSSVSFSDDAADDAKYKARIAAIKAKSRIRDQDSHGYLQQLCGSWKRLEQMRIQLAKENLKEYSGGKNPQEIKRLEKEMTKEEYFIKNTRVKYQKEKGFDWSPTCDES